MYYMWCTSRDGHKWGEDELNTFPEKKPSKDVNSVYGLDLRKVSGNWMWNRRLIHEVNLKVLPERPCNIL